jgi:hypothetical protein
LALPQKNKSSQARQAGEVEALAAELAAQAGPVALPAPPAPLAGTWRLLYSSAFVGGWLGGARPGPPAALLPAQFGPVYQRIDLQSGKLDNIVSLLPAPLPFLPPPFGGAGAEGRPYLRLILRHDFELVGPSTVQARARICRRRRCFRRQKGAIC